MCIRDRCIYNTRYDKQNSFQKKDKTNSNPLLASNKPNDQSWETNKLTLHIYEIPGTPYDIYNKNVFRTRRKTILAFFVHVRQGTVRICFVAYPSKGHAIIILCDVREGIYWHGSRTVALDSFPMNASIREVPSPANWPGSSKHSLRRPRPPMVVNH